MAFKPISYRFHEAAQTGDVSLLTKLFKTAAKTDYVDENGNSALHIAVANNQTTAVKMLLEYGFEVDKPNNQLLRPLHLAAINDNRDITLLLLQHKAKCTHPSREGFLPIHFTESSSKTHQLLFRAKQGLLTEQYEEINEVPIIPEYSIPKPVIKTETTSKKDKKGKKGGKKGKKKKK